MAQVVLKEKQTDLEKFLNLTHFRCKGLVCISHINKFNRWQELFVPAEKALTIINNRLKHNTNQYISVNEFNKNKSRKESNITQLRSLYVDIDVKHNEDTTAYKENVLTDSAAFLLIEDIESALMNINAPTPTMIINSGRGLQLYWSFNPVPKQYMQDYKLAQQIIFKALESVGADANALDASRVLRIPQTLNTKSNTIASIISGNEYVYDFFELTEQLQLNDDLNIDANTFKSVYKREVPLNKVTPPNKGTTTAKAVIANYNIKKAMKDALKPTYSKSTTPTLALHNARLADYTRLLELKYDGEAPAGQQDLFLFLITVSLSNINTNTTALKEAVLEINNKYVHFTEAAALAVMSTTLKLHKEKKVYKYTSIKIIELLKITAEDMETFNLRTLITKELRYSRRNKKRFKTNREEYLKINCVSKIARILGKNRRTIKNWLDTGKIKAEDYID